MWVRHPEGHWIECLWRDETTYRHPFTDEIYQNAVDLALARPGTDARELNKVSADIKKRAAASAMTFEKAKARDKKALELAAMEHTPFPSATAAIQSAVPSSRPFGTEDDEDDETAEIDFATLSEMTRNG